MTGYSGTPLVKKLGIKPGARVAIVNAPDDFQATLGDLPEDVTLAKPTTTSLDLILYFVLSTNTCARLRKTRATSHQQRHDLDRMA